MYKVIEYFGKQIQEVMANNAPIGTDTFKVYTSDYNAEESEPFFALYYSGMEIEKLGAKTAITNYRDDEADEEIKLKVRVRLVSKNGNSDKYWIDNCILSAKRFRENFVLEPFQMNYVGLVMYAETRVTAENGITEDFDNENGVIFEEVFESIIYFKDKQNNVNVRVNNNTL